MTFFNLFIEHDRAPEEEEWLKQEIIEQEARYQQIVVEMDALAPTREKWYQDFFARIQTRGYNTDGDERMKINAEDIPVKPDDRKDQVVWKYGVDEE